MTAIVQEPGKLARAAESDGRLIDIVGALRVIRRRMRLVLSVAAALFTLILVGSLFIPPTYTSVAQIALDPGKTDVANIQAVVPDAPPANAGVVDTEVEVVKSAPVAAAVIKRLGLESDPEFNAALRPKSLVDVTLGGLRALLTPAGPKGPNGLIEGVKPGVLSAVQSKLAVQRQGLTYAINISFTSLSSGRSAQVANAFAQAYLDAQAQARVQTTRQANAWIDGRLNDLVGQVKQADQQVADYRDQNNLLNTTGNSSLAEQEITNLDQQLAQSRAQQAEADARLATARSQLAHGSLGDDVGEALNSEVVRNLKAQRAIVTQRLADISGRYGPQHPEILKAQSQLQDIDNQIRLEIRRIISNLQAQAEAARQRTGSIAGSVSGVRGALSSNSRASVQLDELQRKATSLRTLYESLLNRAQETQAQTSLPTVSARIVSQAIAPGVPTSPKRLLIVLLAIVVGGGAGLATALLLDMFDDRLTSAQDVERRSGVPCVGSIPLLSSLLRSGEKRVYSPTDYIVSKPLSSFAEAFRNLGVALLAGDAAAKVIEVTSASPGEGKTTTSICLARTLAMSGRRVLLIEGDLRRRAFSRLLGKDPAFGLVEVLHGSASFEQAAFVDAPSGAVCLQVSRDTKLIEDPFSTEAMKSLMERARQQFDVIIVDAPPTLAVADARVLAQHVDAVLVVGRWRRTTFNILDACLKSLRSVDAPIAGVALTQVDARQMRYYDYGEAAFLSKAYSPYYVN